MVVLLDSRCCRSAKPKYSLVCLFIIFRLKQWTPLKHISVQNLPQIHCINNNLHLLRLIKGDQYYSCVSRNNVSLISHWYQLFCRLERITKNFNKHSSTDPIPHNISHIINVSTSECEDRMKRYPIKIVFEWWILNKLL